MRIGKAAGVTVKALREKSDLTQMLDAGRDRYAAQNDFTFWSAIYFKTRAQRDAFLTAMGWETDPDDSRVIDGVTLAKKMGLTLPPAPSLWDAPPKRIWASLALAP